MKFVKSLLLGTGAVVLAGLVLTLAAPKAAHAIAATLVQVTNTRSSPVPTQDVDIAARHPFTATCNVFSSGGAFFGCSPTPAPPATGFETVIQSVSILLNQDTGNAVPDELVFNYGTGGNFYTQWLPYFAQGPGFWVVHQLTAIYVDPSPVNTLQCQTLLLNPPATATLFCTVTGYTVALP